VKIFTTEVRPERGNRRVDYGDIWEVLQVLGKHDGVARIHAEDNDLVMHMYEKMIREGRVNFELMSEVHNALSEELAFRRVIRLAENVERAALYMMHVSSRRALEVIAESRAKGYPIYGEALHQYALFTEDHYKRPSGQIDHTYPSLKTKDDHKAMWAAMVGGSIRSIATDGLCTPFALKVSGNRFDNTVAGSAGIETRVSIMHTEAVVRRGWRLEHFVDLVSTNAARIFGLYPRKCVVAPGSDADIVVFDPGLAGPIKKENLHETDYSAWEGYDAAVWPSLTILRGKIVVENGKFFGEPNDGQWLPRKIAESVLSGPAAA
jgi:dihydropyrimidinase